MITLNKVIFYPQFIVARDIITFEKEPSFILKDIRLDLYETFDTRWFNFHFNSSI